MRYVSVFYASLSLLVICKNHEEDKKAIKSRSIKTGIVY